MLLPISGWNWMKQRIQRHDVFRGWLYAALYFLRVMQQNPQKNVRACCFLILTSGNRTRETRHDGRPASPHSHPVKRGPMAGRVSSHMRQGTQPGCLPCSAGETVEFPGLPLAGSLCAKTSVPGASLYPAAQKDRAMPIVKTSASSSGHRL